jgi:two-component system, cell cycle sensor histidine kinase and response regulator CckA
MTGDNNDELSRLASFSILNPNPILEVDAAGKIIFSNPAAVTVLAELGIDKDLTVFLPADLSNILKLLGNKIGSTIYREVTIRDRTFGETIYLHPPSRTARIYSHNITERRLTEKALQDTEERFRLAMLGANDGLWDWNLLTDEVYYSPRWKAMLGYAEDELENHLGTWRALVFPDDLYPTLAQVRDLIEGRTNKYEVEFRMRHKDGHYLDILSRAFLVRNARGEALRMVGTHVDISDRKRLERAIIRAKEEWEKTFDASSDPIMILDTDCRIRRVNRAMAELIGLSFQDVIGKFCYDLVHKADAPVPACPHSRLLEDCRSHSGEIFEAHLGKHFLVTVSPIVDADGSLLGSVHYTKDITEKKLAEKALCEREAYLRAIIDNEPECVKLLARDGSLMMMNPAGLAMIQAESLEQVKGQCVYPLVAPAYREAFKALTEDVYQGKEGWLEFEMMGLMGRPLLLDTHAVPLRNEKGDIVAALGLTRDITARRKAEDDLRRSEEFVRSILDNVDEGFIVVDRDLRILTANRAYCLQTGIPLENIVGEHCFKISHKTLKPCYEEGEECAVKAVFETGETHTALHRHEDDRGNMLYVETKAFPLKDTDGAVTSVIETITNITERHLLEAEQLKTQKLEAIGTLAGGIAHDFNNLLQGIFGYISMAKMKLNDREKALAMLEQTEKALTMSINLTTQLLTFSKGGKPAKRKIDLRPVIENAAKFALSGSRCDYHLTFGEDLWHADADEGQIGQVMQNIVMNANEAMPDGGTIEISANNVEVPQGGSRSLPGGGRFIRIAVRDTGIGIPDQYLSRIFDPYFTTKQRGSGLGLATSYSIVRNHGGAIEVTSEPNTGTIFTIDLPAREAEEIRQSQPMSPAAGRKGRILVMDDEEIVRNVAQQMIEALGHDVDCAANGEDAVEKFRMARESDMPFDIVILDLTVKGGMGGEQAVRKIREIDHNVVAIVSSGYGDSSVVSDYRSYGFTATLNKPYRIDTLRDRLNEFLVQV